VHLPILIITLHNDSQWLFGRVMCKVYFTAENLPKLTSTYLLALMSCERYMVVCQPSTAMKYVLCRPQRNQNCGRYRHTWVAVGTLLVVFVVSAGLLIPVPILADVNRFDVACDQVLVCSVPVSGSFSTTLQSVCAG
jgi:hypothetical protein